MKRKKAYTILVTVLMMTMIVISSVSAATCPNCASSDVDYWILDYMVDDGIYCDGLCEIEKWRVDDNWGCNDCYYNWGGFSHYYYLHSDPLHN